MKKTLLVCLSLTALSCTPAVFAAKSVFERSKPHCNVGTYGQTDQGKSTLTAALAAASGTPLASVVLFPDDSDSTINPCLEASLAKVETDMAHYVIYDFGEQDTMENLLRGPVELDGAILVVSAADGLMPQTREQVMLAGQQSAPSIVVFLNLDGVRYPEQIDHTQKQVFALLAEAGYDSTKIPVIRGSASGALHGDAAGLLALADLMDALDESAVRP